MKSNGEHEKERKWQVTQQVASNLIVVAGGIVLYLTLNNLDVVKDVVGELIGILSPFMAGLVLAYLLDGLARFFQQKLLGGKHRTFAVILAYMVTLLLLGCCALCCRRWCRALPCWSTGCRNTCAA